MEANVDVYNRYVHEYRDYSLYPPERRVLEHFRGRWGSMRVLDIGIGTGRTTFTLSAISASYTGIDYAEEMVRESQRVVGESDHVVLRQCDARDLSEYYGAPFDLVLFSLNGLDSVTIEDREKIMVEVRKVLAPGGCFIFSTHLLGSFSVDPLLPAFSVFSPLRSGYFLAKAYRHRARLRKAHRQHNLDEIKKQDWAVLKTGDHGFEIDIFHIAPHFQRQQLDKLGFEIDAVYDPDGQSAVPEESKADWLYYFCSAKKT